MKIEDGTGSGYNLKIDNKNRAKVIGENITDEVASAYAGEAFNIHTGSITLSAAGTLMYIKNNEERDLVIKGMIVALGSGTFSDSAEVNTFKNATAGDLLTDATPVVYESNRNYGSTNELDADMYKGKSGGTVTAEQVGLYFMGGSQRLFAEINKIVPRGSSIAVSIDPKLASGTVKCYCVLTCHLRDEGI